MIRNLKSLALLVGALLAIAGLMASVASAHVPPRFTFEQHNVTVTGEDAGNAVFKVTNREVVCTTETYDGHVTVDPDDTSAETITVTPTYTGCTAFGFAGAKVTGFGHYGEADTCDYHIWADGTADLECEPGAEVTVEVGTTCISHVPEQTDLGTITYTTETKETVGHRRHDLRVHVDLDSITVTHTDLNFLCPFAGSGEVGNAELEGTGTLWAEDPDTQTLTGITWDPTQAV